MGRPPPATAATRALVTLHAAVGATGGAVGAVWFDTRGSARFSLIAAELSSHAIVTFHALATAQPGLR